MAKDLPIQFKGTTLKIIQVQLRTADIGNLHAALAELTGNAPDFFDCEPALLDFRLAEVPPESIDWAPLLDLLGRSGLLPIATCGLPKKLADEAAAAGLPPLSPDALPGSRGARAKAEPDVQSEPMPPAPPPVVVAEPQATASAPLPRTITLDKPLRSGQRFYAKDCDLIVTAMVSAGAEVIADGNIHIYAPLRGRALAGASGDRAARIFTTSLEAELVSVAGLYRTFEAGMPSDLVRQPATVALLGEGDDLRLNVAALALR